MPRAAGGSAAGVSHRARRCRDSHSRGRPRPIQGRPCSEGSVNGVLAVWCSALWFDRAVQAVKGCQSGPELIQGPPPVDRAVEPGVDSERGAGWIQKEDSGEQLQGWRCRDGAAGMPLQGWCCRDGAAGMALQRWCCMDGAAGMALQGWCCRVGTVWTMRHGRRRMDHSTR